jgi:glycosyltransferase involved in cell wall biosynthesis
LCKISDLKKLNFSIIIAVYQREDELSELLLSLTKQIDSDFEVLVVDDGSPIPLKNVVEKFNSKLNIRYFHKKNSGPAASRNFGMKQAFGSYFIFLDSDTLIPPDYIQIVRQKLTENYTDAFGGPDAADESFTDLQKAISFSMTSFITTGGIRGGEKQIGKFQPRSFNMGISRKAYEKTSGFSNLRIGEDPDLSMNLWEKGLETQLILEAKVFHKRRTSLSKFAKQVYQFGVARPILNQRHPKYKKITFWFPSVFSLGLLFALFCCFFWFLSKGNYFLLLPLFGYWVYFFLIFIFSFLENQKLKVAFLSIITTFVQFCSYGLGFLLSWILLNLFKRKPEKAFPHHFRTKEE